jgi:arylsulfatase A-like enzyme
MAASKHPNIILITIDSLRADHCGWLNPEAEDLTPFLNKIANESIIFEKAYAPGPSTIFSFPSILSGTYPFSLPGWERGYPSLRRRPLLAKLLKEAGFHTFAFHSNPYLSEYFGYNIGFDKFFYFKKDTFLKEDKSALSKIIESLDRFSLFRLIKKGAKKNLFLLYKQAVNFLAKSEGRPLTIDRFVPAPEINQALQKTLRPEDTPLFLWVHYMDIHHPYLVGEASLTREQARQIEQQIFNYLRFGREIGPEYHRLLKTCYQNSIKSLDKNLKSLLEILEKKGFLKNSILIITSDHGEEFFEHGSFFHTPKLKHHHLYEENIHIPLLIKLPNKEVGRAPFRVSLAWLAPTLLDFLGIEKPELMLKQNLFQSKKGEVIFSQTLRDFHGILDKLNKESYAGAVIKGDFKYIYDNYKKIEELYNLRGDKKEKENLVFNNKELTHQMRRLFKKALYS